MPAHAASEVTRFGTIARSGMRPGLSARGLRRLPLNLNLDISPPGLLSADGNVYAASRIPALRSRRNRLWSILARRPYEAEVDATVGLRRLLYVALALQHPKHFGDLVLSDVAVGVLAPAELQRKPDLVAVRQKRTYLTKLMLEVADVRAGMELYLHDLGGLLRLALLLRADGLFVLELSVVHYLAYGRIRIGRDLDEIKPAVFGHPLSVARGHHADHLALRVKNAHLRHANLVVYTSELCDNSPLFIG